MSATATTWPTLIVGGLKCGMDVSVACPEGYDPDAKVLDFAKTVTDAKFTLYPGTLLGGAEGAM